jgi:hypothetical protein
MFIDFTYQYQTIATYFKSEIERISASFQK